jgi:putative membrane protein
MKGQWGLILGLLAALMIAVFAVINVDVVQVNYLFGTAEWPLILVILGSVLMGSVMAGGLAIVRVLQLQHEVRRLKGRISSKQTQAVEAKPLGQQEHK